MDKEVYDGLLLAVLEASRRKVTAGLEYAASGQHQDYPPGVLELGVALDAIKMLVADMVHVILINQDESWYDPHP